MFGLIHLLLIPCSSYST